MRRQSHEHDETAAVSMTPIEDHLDLELGESETTAASRIRDGPKRCSHFSSLALIAIGFVSCLAMGIIWSSWTSTGFSTSLPQFHLSRILFVILVMVALWWSQRDRARSVAIILQEQIPKYTRRLPRIVINIERYDEIDNDIPEKAMGRDTWPRAASPLQGSIIGDEDFLSCYEESPIGSSRSTRNASRTDQAPLFPRVPQAQRDACLKFLSPDRIQLIREVAQKLEASDRGYGAALKKMGVQDPVHAMKEFGQRFNGYDIGAYRFLSGNGWNVPVTEKKLLNTIRWRALELPKHMENPKLLSALVEKRLIPNIGWDEQTRGRFARDGAPVEYWALQFVNLKKAYDTLGEEGICSGYVQYLETREETVRDVESLGMFVVIDCLDVPIGTIMWQVSYFTKFVSCVGAVGEVHYPEAMTKCVVANAPAFIDTLWKIFKAVLSEATKEKIEITKAMDTVQHHCDMKDIESLKQTIVAQMR